MWRRLQSKFALAVPLCFLAVPAFAAGEAGQIDGKALGIIWVAPFVGILLSIAIMTLATPHFWHHHYGKVSAAWALAFLLPLIFKSGFALTVDTLLHTLLLEYIPFIILITALFCVTGNILIRGNLHGSPIVNTGFLAIGTGLASIMGTTGAAMLLVRPLIRANDDRIHNVHVLVFFIFLVANIGGSLTPLGDPPLFLGFLQGVSFFWPTKHLFLPMLVTSLILLALFFAIDTYFYGKEGHSKLDPTPDSRLRIEGMLNFWLVGGILLAVFLSGSIKLGAIRVAGQTLEVQNILRDLALVAIAVASFKLTPARIREANEFNFAPVIEVAKLFAAIFITIIPAIAILRAGRDGALASVVNLVTTPDGKPMNAMYFWLAGGLSSFLDNAPTYLVFFHAAGGNAEQLMGPMAATLLAISAGSVFMGANTYIGNAPNFMVKSIAESRGVKMPSFFGYMAWSCLVLVPVFALLTWLFFV
jgi:Na+/H+ antiporter NhaD/arsenite permease-like protein